MTFHFNRQKRFGEFGFAEYMKSAQELFALVRAQRPRATMQILTYESTGAARKFRRANMFGDPALETSDYFSYTPERFTEDVWKRVVDAGVRIEDPDEKEPFVITMTVTRRPKMTKLYFWGQLVEEQLFSGIYDRFATPDANTAIGNEIERLSVIGTKKPKQVA